MLQKVLKCANYAVAVLFSNIVLFCSIDAKNFANTIRQGLGGTPLGCCFKNENSQAINMYMASIFIKIGLLK